MGLAEQGTEGENDLGKPEAVEAQASTLLRRAGQRCGNASGELPPQKVRDCCQPPVAVESPDPFVTAAEPFPPTHMPSWTLPRSLDRAEAQGHTGS